jgi:hypothetical protein
MSDQKPNSLPRRSFLGASGVAASLLAGNAVAERGLEITDTFEIRARATRRTWAFSPLTQRIICYPDPKNDCIVAGLTGGFLEAQENTLFHDAQLAGITRQLNAAIANGGYGSNGSSGNDSPNRHMAILITPDGPFLAWVEEGDAIGSAERAEIINSALRIKGFTGRRK